ncbi:hypothetical protein ABZ319_23940 [Nocardia sp. NPDC005978]|uniref:hypothetical protein n=1 Tax=Nocardia sp. NPDC005978 TaxID=3156725 RepID=UPI0033BB671D
MKNVKVGVAVVIAATLLSGCGAEDDSVQSSPGGVTAPAGATSQRGATIKAVGQESGVGKPGAEPVIKWTVTNIEVGAACAEAAAVPAENGQFVVVSVDAATSSEFDQGKIGGPGFFHPGNHWQLVDSAGVPHPHPASDAAYRCTTADWPEDLAPGSRYQFKLTFDSQTPTGTLLFAPPNWAGGWEWTF